MTAFDAHPIRRVPGHRLTALIVAVLVAGMAPFAAAQPATRPVTAPTTAPATTRPVPATAPAASAPVASPKAVAIAFAGMIAKGDAAGAKGLVPDDPPRQHWVDATCGLVGELKQLDAAATARFGEAGKNLSQNELHVLDSIAALEQAQENVEGDTATLTVAGQSSPLRLRKVAGRWQVQTGPSTAEDAEHQVRLLERLAQAAQRTAAEVGTGAYATAEEARKAFAARVLEARLRS